MKTKTPKLPVPLESEILRGVLDLLKAMNFPAWRSNAGGGYRLGKGGKPQLIRAAPEGMPDIIGWVPMRRPPGLLAGPTEWDGRFLAVEVKRPGEKPRPVQIEAMRKINADGGVAFWVDDAGVCFDALTKIKAGCHVTMSTNGDWWIEKP